MDSGSGINAVSSKVTEKLGLEAVHHPHPHKVSWINSTALEVNQLHLVPIDLNLYNDKIWCDVVIMYVGQIILDRPWLFDKDVTIYSQSNMHQFEHKCKKIKLLSLRPKIRQPEYTPIAPKNTKQINLISVKVPE